MHSMNEKADRFLRMLSHDVELGYDVETSGLKWQKCFTCGYSLSDGADAVYVPVRHEGGNNIDRPEEFEAEVNRIIQSRTKPLILWNAKFDMHFSENHGIFLGKNIIDGMVNACLLDENRRSFALGNVAKGYDIEQKKETDLYAHIGRTFNIKPDRSSMSHFYRLSGNDRLAHEYAAADTLVTYQLWKKQERDIYAEQLDTVFHLERELTYVLQKMERRGIGVDPDEKESVKAEIEDMYLSAYAKIPLREDFTALNINSGRDLKEYFEMCDITDWPMTAPTERFPEGQASFKSSYLATHQEGLDILNARKLGHLKSSFLDTIDDHIYNNRIHTTFNQARGETHGTRGGRLSSSNPNKQQVPKRDKTLGRIYRRMFKARSGYVFCELDYSQAEPRLYAHYSDEPALIQGYNSTPAVDMHSVAASYMNIDRNTAKSLNLGMMYTMGARKLAAQLGISYEQALAIYKRWHRTFMRVSEFTKRAEAVAEQRGYVRTILGRRRRFPDSRFCYRAANAIVQGSSADIMKWKLVELDRYLRDNNLEEECKMLLTIHDSVVIEIKEDRQDILKEIVAIMENCSKPPFKLKVPMKVDYHAGKDWSQASYPD